MMRAGNYRIIVLAKRLCCQANISCFVPAEYLMQNYTKKIIERMILYLEPKEGQVLCVILKLDFYTTTQKYW